MGFFDEIGNKSSLTARNNKLSAQINNSYSELGVRYYNLYKDNPDPKFKEIIDGITAAYAEIKQNEIMMAYMRGVVFCPKCGSECSADLKFCVKCGTQLVKPVQPQVQVQQQVPFQVPVQTVQPRTPVQQQVPVQPVQQQVPVQTQAPTQPEYKFCTECGERISATAMFCTNCGKAF